MSTKAQAKMHPDFPSCYREVGLDDDVDRLNRRWSGVSALASSATRDDIEAMVQIAFRIAKVPDEAALVRLHAPFLKADKNFLDWENGREQEILSGATLACMFSRGGPMATVAALATNTTSANGSRRPEVALDLVGLSEQALLRRGEEARNRHALANAMAIQAYAVNFDTAIEKVTAQPDWEGVKAALKSAAESTEKSLGATAKSAGNALAAASKYIAVQEEELQMLWWLVGERSWDLDRAFGTIDSDAAPIVLAKELARIIHHVPPN